MEKATKILYNAKILCLDTFNTVVSAIAFSNDKILCLGTDEEILKYNNDDCECINMAQKTIIPGFYDAHGHLLQYVEFFANFVNLNSPPIGECVSIADCQEKLRLKAKTLPKGEWLLAYGYDDTIIAEKRFPTKEELDAVSTEHKIVVMHISIRFCAVNNLTLDYFGYTKDSKDPHAGVIWRDENNNLTGVLEGTVVNHVFTHFPASPSEKYADAIVEVSKEYYSKGITTAIDAGCGQPKYFHAFLQAEAQGRIDLRLSYNPSPVFIGKKGMENYSSRLLKRLGPKIWYDGSIQGFTAYLSKPYHTAYKGDDKWCGYPSFSKEKLEEYLLEFHLKNEQCVIHCNGDQAIENILDVIEKILKIYPRSDHRFLLIHAQTIREEQLERCKNLGITISFFTIHTYYWGDRHKHIFLGPERVEQQNPMRMAIDKGIVVTSHNDVPILPVNPLLSIWSCVNRISSSGDVIGASQKISAIEALRAHTINPAWQNFEEKEKGSLEVGKYADLAVLDQDPLNCPPMEIRNIKVQETYIGGKLVFKLEN